MNLLILGGTRFVGRHLVEAARAHGHIVTLFNRGQSGPDLFPELETVHGDRGGDLSGRRWDAVVDTCGYVPRVVRTSAELLKGRVGCYLFVSSISVYADETTPHLDEDAATLQLSDPSLAEDSSGETYGARKALCEQVVQARYPDSALVVRPGLIVGPHDPTDRFTYWPQRVAQGGEVLAPGTPELRVQFIDARDLAAWMVTMLERQQTGVYNAITPTDRFSMGELLATCQQVSGSGARLTWVDEAFLLEQQVTPFTELPLWLPGDEVNFMRVNGERAQAQGLNVRALADTLRDTLAWSQTQPLDTPRRAGLTRAREEAILRAWHEREQRL